MASLTEVKDGVCSQIITLTTGMQLGTDALSVEVGIEWPPEDKVLCVGTDPLSGIIAITDKKFTHDGGGWMPSLLSQTQNPCATDGVLSDVQPHPGDTVTATLSLISPATEPNKGDIVALGVRKEASWGAVSVTADTGDTLATLATALAAKVNASATLSPWIAASALGAVVSLHNISGAGLVLGLNTGNSFTRRVHVKKTCAYIQVSIFAGSIAARDLIGDAIERLFAQFKADWGFALDSGELVRVASAESMCLDDGALKGIFRRDFIIQIDYQVDIAETAYPVLAGIFDLT